jgi:DNA-binding XRE family transcriptional regulator
MSVASTPSGSTLSGRPTTHPADSGPATHRTTAPHTQLHIGVVIRRLRRRRGISQTVFADLIGYSPSWLSQVERGARGVDSITAMRAIARVLDVDVHKLIEVVL